MIDSIYNLSMAQNQYMGSQVWLIDHTVDQLNLLNARRLIMHLRYPPLLNFTYLVLEKMIK